MCGIIGYVGKAKRAVPILLEGLKNLEYRGYDSAGIACVKNERIEIVKSTGPIVNLESKVDASLSSSVGIGHTRWATHGEPSEINSHPHKVGKMTIVHNGIIENYLEIKNELAKSCVEFKSETDTEVAAALLDTLYKKYGDIHKTIREFQSTAKGSYAIAMLCDDKLDEIYLIKNLSPIVVGFGNDESFVASDIQAILKWTKKYVILADRDYAIVRKDEIQLFDNESKEKQYKPKIFDGDVNEISKGEYEHFMLKEIHDQPDVMRRLLTKYIVNKEFNNLPDIAKYKCVTIVACGSAMHAGLVGKYFLEKHANIPVNVELASEFRYKKLFLDENSLVIAISQSGETADTLAAVKIAKENGAHTMGIVNVAESSIAREVDDVIYTLAGSEIAVATTKAYFAQCLVLLFIALRNNMNKEVERELSKVSTDIERMLKSDDLYKSVAEKIYAFNDIFFIGRQIDYALCMEGSLKLKEISYIHSEAYAAGELKHGTISLIENDTPVIAVITDASIAEKTVSNIKEVSSRGAFVITIVCENIHVDAENFSDVVIKLPEYSCGIESILGIIPLQRIAYEVAKKRGCSIDKPRNLAKSVTVE